MGDTHVLHRLGWCLVFDDFVVVSRYQPVEWVSHEAEAEMAEPVVACTAERDQLCLLIGFVLPELVRGRFGAFGWHFSEKTAKGRFDRGIGRLGNPPIEQVVVFHPDEVMRLGHELRAFGEIFFEEFAK